MSLAGARRRGQLYEQQRRDEEELEESGRFGEMQKKLRERRNGHWMDPWDPVLG
jgi:hypothetical protein